MFRITKFQLYCMLLMLASPLAYLETPNLLIHNIYNNAWLAVIGSIIPGVLLMYMYSHLIKKSRHPFPLLLDEHLGFALGRIIGFIYIVFFFLVCSYTLRLFIEFMKMNVLPATPISVFIAVLLFIGFLAIRTGLENLARICELLVMVGLPFSFLIVIIALLNNFHLERMLPVAYMDYQALGIGIINSVFVLGKIMPVLSLAFFLEKKENALFTMNSVLLTHVPLIALTTLSIIIILGTIPALSFTFPTFNMIRLARIGSFIQNLDIIFIGIWTMGIFAAVTIPWFMACFTAQKVFNLRDYRFLAAPSVLIIGVLSVAISRNNVETVVWSLRIIPPLYLFFFIAIPFLIFLITLFKPYPENSSSEPAPPDSNSLGSEVTT
ncbi:MAG: GerAB/ArcD/ProY family transporter [Syntrophomonadaceae bacterium]|nr:GerAB/ArcD/ProY family transporter [Syntrophomonadaceae bacterium]